VEVCFYALLPLWAAAMVWLGSGTRRGLGLELAILAGLVAIQFTVIVLIAAGDLTQFWALNIPAKAGFFAVGMALALASIRLTEPWPSAIRLTDRAPGLLWLGAAACLLALGLRPGGERGPFLVRPQESLGAALEDTLVSMALSLCLVTLIVLPAVFGDPDRGLVRRLLGSRPLSWVGLVSYGAYLWHFAVAALILTTTAGTRQVGLGLADDVSTPVAFLLTATATLAIAALSYYLVELPFLRRKEPRGSRAPSPEPAGERGGLA
jgi:peptidoglycan/LPS O-acetylase OafA/YrhL